MEGYSFYKTLMEEYTKIKDLPYDDRLTFVAQDMLRHKMPVEIFQDEKIRTDVAQRMVEILLNQKSF